MKRQLSELEIEDIKKRRAAGEYVKTLAREYKIRPKKVIEICGKVKVKRQPKPISSTQFEENIQIASSKVHAAEATFNNIHPGDHIILDFNKDTRKGLKSRAAKLNIHEGSVIQKTNSIIAVKSSSGRVQSFSLSEIICGDVCLKLVDL